MAAAMALLAFAVCLVAGLVAGNDAATVLLHALEGMGVTLAVGLVVGFMARRMIEENVSALRAKQQASDAAGPGAEKIPGTKEAKPAGGDR
jgi:hypothetical protein